MDGAGRDSTRSSRECERDSLRARFFCLLLRSITISMVSICRAGSPRSIGSVFTGVIGGEAANDGTASDTFEYEWVLDLVERVSSREVSGGSGFGCENAHTGFDSVSRKDLICVECRTRSSRVMPRVCRRRDIGEEGFRCAGSSAMILCTEKSVKRQR